MATVDWKTIYRGLTARPKNRGKSIADRIDPLTFMRDPDLLNYEPTLGGRCFVKAAYGMPLDSEEEDFLAQEYDGHAIAARPEGGWSPDGYPECVLACGRRSTKTFMASKLALYEAVTSDYREAGYIGRSERAYIVCIAQDLPAAIDLAQTNMASDLSNSKLLRHMVVPESRKVRKKQTEEENEDDEEGGYQHTIGTTKNRIVMHTGNIILSLASNAKASRGRPYPVIIVDEFAHFVRITGTQNTDCMVLQAIKPGGSQFGKRRKIFYLSTPSGQRGEFYDLFRARQDNAAEQFTMHAPTWLMNPAHEVIVNGERVVRGITDEYLDSEYRKNPIGFEQEYGALFIDPTFGLIPGQDVDACFDDAVPTPVPGPHPFRIMCIDPATKRDTCAIVIGHYDMPTGAVIIDHLDGLEPRRASRTLRNSRQTGLIVDEQHDPTVGKQSGQTKEATTAGVSVSPEEMIQLASMLYKAWGCSEVWTDQHLAPMFIPALRETGLNARSFTYGGSERQAMYMLLKTAIVAGRLKVVGRGEKWPERLRSELKTVHVESTPRGSWTIKKGEASGDDFVDGSAHLCRRLWGHFRLGALGDWMRYSTFGGQGSKDAKVMAAGSDTRVTGWREALRNARAKRQEIDRTKNVTTRVSVPRVFRPNHERIGSRRPNVPGGNPYGLFRGPNPYSTSGGGF